MAARTIHIAGTTFTIESVTRMGLAAAILLIAAIGMIVYAPDRSKIMETQYQSYRYAVVAADTFVKTNALLAIPLAPRKGYRRFEDVTNDDPGFPLILSVATRLGLLRFDQDLIRKLYPSGSDTAESRRIMLEELVSQTASLGTYFFMATICVLVLFLMFGNIAIPPIQIFVMAVGLLALPFILPNIFLDHLHSHSLIPTCIGLAFLGAVMLVEADRARNVGISILLLAILGVLLGFIDLIRHSQGLAAMAALTIFSLLVVRGWAAKTGAIFALAAGMVVSGWMVDLIQNARDDKLGIVQSPRNIDQHPIYHTLLTGLNAYPQNALGIASESDAVSVVRADIGQAVSQNSPEYLLAARRVFVSYILQHPFEYLRVLMTKTNKAIKLVKAMLGLKGNWLWVVLAANGLAWLFWAREGRNDAWWLAGFGWGLLIIGFYAPLASSAHFVLGVLATFCVLTILIWSHWFLQGKRLVNKIRDRLRANK